MHNVALAAGAHHSQTMSLCVMLCSPQVQVPPVTTQHSYNVVDYNLCAVPYISVTYLFAIIFILANYFFGDGSIMLTRVKRLLTLPGKTTCKESEAACQCL